MNKSVFNVLIIFIFAGSLLNCKTPTMKLDDELKADSVAYKFESKPGSDMKGRLKFGTYEAYDFTASPKVRKRQSSSEGFLQGLFNNSSGEYVTDQKFNFNFVDTRTNEIWQVSCKTRLEESVSSEQDGKMTSTSTASDFELTGSAVDSNNKIAIQMESSGMDYIGTVAINDKDKIEFSSTRAVNESSFEFMISGYIFKIDGKSIAAIDVCPEGGFFLSKNIKKEYISPLAAAGALLWVTAHPGSESIISN